MKQRMNADVGPIIHPRMRPMGCHVFKERRNTTVMSSDRTTPAKAEIENAKHLDVKNEATPVR